MKKILLCLLVVGLLSACSDDTDSPSLIKGKWQGMLNCTRDYQECFDWENSAWEFEVTEVIGDSLVVENFKQRHFDCEADPDCKLLPWKGYTGSKYKGDSVIIRVASYPGSRNHVFKGVLKGDKMMGEIWGMYGTNEENSWIFSENQVFNKQ